MRIGLSGIRTLADPHGLHTLRDDRERHVAEVLEEPFEPELQVEPVPQDELCALRPFDVARGRRIIVDLGAGFGDRFHDRGVARHVLRHVGDHREGRYRLEFLLGRRRDETGGRQSQHPHRAGHDQPPGLVEHWNLVASGVSAYPTTAAIANELQLQSAGSGRKRLALARFGRRRVFSRRPVAFPACRSLDMNELAFLPLRRKLLRGRKTRLGSPACFRPSLRCQIGLSLYGP